MKNTDTKMLASRNNVNSIQIGYKKSDLGFIPNEWDVKSIIELADRNKKNFDDDDWIEAKYLENSGIRLIQTGNIGIGYFIDKKTKKYISEKSFIDLRCKVISEGDILICRLAAPAGRACIMPYIGEEKLITSVDVSIFKPLDSLVNRQYLTNVLSMDKWFKIINEKCGGSTRTRISRSELGKLKLPIPPLSEQQKIAEILSTWDRAILNCNLTIKSIKARNKGLAQQLLTGKKRLNEFGDNWTTKKIKDFSLEISSKNKEDEDMIVLSCTKHNGLVPSLEYFGRKIYSDNLKTYKIVEKNVFAYATNHIEEGSIGYQSKYEKALISPMYTVFKTEDDINDEFLFRVLKSNTYIQEYQKRMEGSIDRRGGLRWQEFSKIKVSVPSYEEQTAIALALETADQELKSYETKLEALQLQKKGLMQQLLTGKIRVNL